MKGMATPFSREHSMLLISNASDRLEQKFDLTSIAAAESTSLIRGMVIKGIPFDF